MVITSFHEENIKADEKWFQLASICVILPVATISIRWGIWEMSSDFFPVYCIGGVRSGLEYPGELDLYKLTQYPGWLADILILSPFHLPSAYTWNFFLKSISGSLTVLSIDTQDLCLKSHSKDQRLWTFFYIHIVHDIWICLWTYMHIFKLFLWGFVDGFLFLGTFLGGVGDLGWWELFSLESCE